jgi:hypothetical protein
MQARIMEAPNVLPEAIFFNFERRRQKFMTFFAAGGEIFMFFNGRENSFRTYV